MVRNRYRLNRRFGAAGFAPAIAGVANGVDEATLFGEFTKAITKSIDAQFVMERMQHLYVIIQFLYNVVLSRFGYACSYAYPNVLARELSQANNVQG